ncbi:Rqc2 family fibronectin-binding protein [Alkalithermobacter paradoxus]|uniref:Rqc2 homolog RqcH n=1 Tax=Alkalithermobacter paradoxus TaxID=29349 RepID=A0A1V4IA72_9FIRM|nr:hypothetical protein CLOTH_01800 [[Clostridium] thermoalcaliphilum]
MALDGIVIYSLVDELSSKLIGGKIDKVYQPEDDELMLHIRSDKTNYKLLLSANSSNPRLYISSTHSKENPISAPLFCMILRKHIQNGRIVNISQPNFERIIKITVESLDELKNIKTKDIIIEIMGKHSNIILVDKKENKIIDSIKRIPINVNTYREILPGKKYIYPPSQDKLNPLEDISLSYFKDILYKNNNAVFKSIYSSFVGVSPSIAKEVCFRACIDENSITTSLDSSQIENLFESFRRMFGQIKNNIFYPCIVIDKRIDKVIDFSCIKLHMYSDYSFIKNESISFILEQYYYKKDAKERIHQKSQDLRKSVSTKLDRLYNKLKKQSEELNESKNAYIYKTYGELITSYIYMIKKGMEEIEVINFYDEEGSTVNIKLDKSLTPSENAQRYFKKYSKLKNAEIEISEQIDITSQEIEYLENILLNIGNCENTIELEEIKEELIKHGYAKRRKDFKSKDKAKPKSEPYEFVSCDGFKIYVGKNNKQNDYLTFKIGSNEDIWLHTKDIPGSHVIIKSDGKSVPDSTLLEGAVLAAYFSKGRMSSKVPVDYTPRKNVKKPSGSKPGMVIYENNNTIYVTPCEEIFTKIKNR